MPSLGIATAALRQAAAVQARMLGYNPEFIWVPHPIQDRTDKELCRLADTYFNEVLKALTT